MYLNYVLVFCKQQNWFNSPYILWTAILSIVFFFWLIIRQKNLKRKIIHFDMFLLPNVRHGIGLIVFMGIYLSSTSVYMQWNMAALGYNNLINAGLGLWGLPSLILGGVLAFIGFKKKWNLKYFILLGFGAFFVHSLMIYFLIQPQMNYEHFYLLIMVRNFGMVVLFIGAWQYATSGMPQEKAMGVTGFLVMFRTFVATAFGGAIVAFASQYFQLQSMTDMGNYWDQTMMGPAAMRGFGTMQINSLLAAGKTLMGWMCWMYIPIAIYILNHDYGTNYLLQRVYISKLLKREPVKGYRYSVK